MFSATTGRVARMMGRDLSESIPHSSVDKLCVCRDPPLARSISGGGLGHAALHARLGLLSFQPPLPVGSQLVLGRGRPMAPVRLQAPRWRQCAPGVFAETPPGVATSTPL